MSFAAVAPRPLTPAAGRPPGHGPPGLCTDAVHITTVPGFAAHECRNAEGNASPVVVAESTSQNARAAVPGVAKAPNSCRNDRQGLTRVTHQDTPERNSNA